MKIIGCDFHPSFQQIAMVDRQTGEYTERRLRPEEARQFYAELKGPVLVGMEACGNTLWFERLLGSLGIEVSAGRCRQDPGDGSAQAEDGAAGCAVAAAVAAGESLSRGRGARAWSSATRGSCCCTVTSWWGCGGR